MDKALAIGLAVSLGIGSMAVINVPRADDGRSEAGSIDGLIEDFEHPLFGGDLSDTPGGPNPSRDVAAWSAQQATGRPDTPDPGDIATAWASQTPDGQNEWLELTYRQAVRPVAVVVFETYSPGALSQIEFFDDDGQTMTVWGDDPHPVPAAKRVLVAPVVSGFATDRIRLHLLSPQVPGWNEIDAVGLLDESGRMHWAVRATASSSWADSQPDPMTAPPEVELIRQRLELWEAELEQTRREFASRLDELQSEYQDLRRECERLTDAP